jgi:hypothetical protein
MRAPILHVHILVEAIEHHLEAYRCDDEETYGYGIAEKYGPCCQQKVK